MNKRSRRFFENAWWKPCCEIKQYSCVYINLLHYSNFVLYCYLCAYVVGFLVLQNKLLFWRPKMLPWHDLICYMDLGFSRSFSTVQMNDLTDSKRRHWFAGRCPSGNSVQFIVAERLTTVDRLRFGRSLPRDGSSATVGLPRDQVASSCSGALELLRDLSLWHTARYLIVVRTVFFCRAINTYERHRIPSAKYFKKPDHPACIWHSLQCLYVTLFTLFLLVKLSCWAVCLRLSTFYFRSHATNLKLIRWVTLWSSADMSRSDF